MTWATPFPTSPSAGEPATKFGMAIGIGWKVPSVICTRACAFARRAKTGAARSAAPAPSTWRRVGRRRAMSLSLKIVMA
jgi:hypothetical protein